MKTKDDRKNSQNKQIARISPFSWIFPRFFQKALVGNKLFYFFHYFFILFSEQGSQKIQPQKLAPTTEVGCGLQKFSTFSDKRAKTLTIFFYIFPNFFGNSDETKQSEAAFGSAPNGCREAAQKISDFSDKRAKSYACFTEVISKYVFRKAQHTRRWQLGQSVLKL